MIEAFVEIASADMKPDGGHCWCVVMSALASGDSESEPQVSQLVLLEDGKPLGPAHSVHAEIRGEGGGRFSHWGNLLFFSTSDNSDPRSSRRRYSVIGPKRIVRGWDVVPSFTGGGQLDPKLMEEMERHPEAAGKSSWGTRNVLHAFILSLRPKIVLEIGAHIGSASVVMGTALKANGYGTLFCLEPEPRYIELLETFVQKSGLTDYVRPLQLYSTSPELDQVLADKADIIYLDANHTYTHAMRDLLVCDRLLANNGLMFLDDVGPEVSPRLDADRRGGVRKALLDFTNTREDLQVIFLEPPFWLNPCGLGIVCKQSLRALK